MSVTKKQTLEPVTDNSLGADKSPGDSCNNSGQHEEPRREAQPRLALGRGSPEAEPCRRRAGGRSQLLAKDRVLWGSGWGWG